MSDRTKIPWADATVNAWRGCTKISEGCANCYALRVCNRLEFCRPDYAPVQGLVAEATDFRAKRTTLRWTGRLGLDDTQLVKPLRWKAPRVIFWNALSDMFHEGAPDEWRDRCFAAMALTPQHTHVILTKRAGGMAGYLSAEGVERRRAVIEQILKLRAYHWEGFAWPLPNVWLGATVENQRRADERLPRLAVLSTLGWKTFASVEPLLGPVDISPWFAHDYDGGGGTLELVAGVRGVIVGGESGPGARPMHPDWVRSLRSQCDSANVPFYFKQWSGVNKKKAGRELDGKTYDALPWREAT